MLYTIYQNETKDKFRLIQSNITLQSRPDDVDFKPIFSANSLFLIALFLTSMDKGFDKSIFQIMNDYLFISFIESRFKSIEILVKIPKHTDDF